MPKLTFLQAKSIAAYSISQFWNYTYITFSGISGFPSTQVDTSYERALDTFASYLLSIISAGTDSTSELDILNSLAVHSTNYVYLINLFAGSCRVLGYAPSSWPNQYYFLTVLQDAYSKLELLYSNSTSGGGGGSITAEDIGNAIGAAVTGSPYFLIYPSNEVFPED